LTPMARILPLLIVVFHRFRHHRYKGVLWQEHIFEKLVPILGPNIGRPKDG
jgi:hypothetical protein